MPDIAESGTVDVIVIGMGQGGEEVAGSLADAGLSVLGIDQHLVAVSAPTTAAFLEDDDPCRERAVDALRQLQDP